MLDLVNCKVLSVVKSGHVDAYLLSESSMFVFPHKLILKTCGTTTLLNGLPRMMEIAARCAGFSFKEAECLNSTSVSAIPYRVFYSRKNYLYPDKQHGPHRSWRDEVKFLDRMFAGGSAYMVGKMNGEHWYLYVTNPCTTLTPPPTPEWEELSTREAEARILSMAAEPEMSSEPMNGPDAVEDETLEILMTDLDPENAKQFYLDHANAVAADKLSVQATTVGGINGVGHVFDGRQSGDVRNGIFNGIDHLDVFENGSDNDELSLSDEANTLKTEPTTEGHLLGTIVSDNCGLGQVYPPDKYPDARIDAYLFTPCGFSANGVVPAPGGDGCAATTHYFTVHVTPEPHCSYASFETNVPSRQTGRETADVVEQVVNIFRPGRFSVTLFEAKASFNPQEKRLASKEMDLNAAKRSARMECIKGYRRIERIVHDLNGYDLVFRYYERDDWKGGAPRLGEVAM